MTLAGRPTRTRRAITPNNSAKMPPIAETALRATFLRTYSLLLLARSGTVSMRISFMPSRPEHHFYSVPMQEPPFRTLEGSAPSLGDPYVLYLKVLLTWGAQQEIAASLCSRAALLDAFDPQTLP